MYETLITMYASPVYFGTQIAEDIGIPVNEFLKDWNGTEQDRSVGNATFEEAVASVMQKHGCDCERKLKEVAFKRIAAKRECFLHLHPQILPMLSELKKRGIKIGLISNCFSEEAVVIRESILFPFFDAAYLSYEQGIQKPDPEIFGRCMRGLNVQPEECLYVGHGGSQELETAREMKMKALQAAWYFQEGTAYPQKRKGSFPSLETPLDVLNHL